MILLNVLLGHMISFPFAKVPDMLGFSWGIWNTFANKGMRYSSSDNKINLTMDCKINLA